jgi:hypothetical protein
MARRIGRYFAWDRPAETAAPLADLNNRFPTLYELRRTLWPRYEALADTPGGQDIEAYLHAIFFHNFAGFEEHVATLQGFQSRRWVLTVHRSIRSLSG